ncbi:hypothetical protein F2S72_09635 [Pseudomonas syringae pv. actinidiae]|nr:hypothetical protein [Pseudomonas syringae pv. actinidiae]
MSDQQLSFLGAAPAAFDVNAVDGALIQPTTLGTGSVGAALSQRSVDDWVLGLGFTNWKALIDHAIQTGHFELYGSDDGCQGLRKHGYRYAPIPCLPVGAATYIQQRLLLTASSQTEAGGRQERLVTVSPDFSYKCVIASGVCDLTVKQDGEVIRATIQVHELAFSDRLGELSPLIGQLAGLLISAGAREGLPLVNGCKALASHMTRIAMSAR